MHFSRADPSRGYRIEAKIEALQELEMTINSNLQVEPKLAGLVNSKNDEELLFMVNTGY